ncbi:MAG: hypothetical protein SGJ09_02385 [Phycisphaerae bacterium]|nr:hypothetical protein [Phycisphaerae bacterium]
MPTSCVVILGMHRSGTSALARTLALCGGSLPKTLFPPVPGDNDTGYWESERLILFNEYLLAELGTSAFDERVPDPTWFGTPAAEQRAIELACLLLEEWGDAPGWIVKEPRTCRLVPLLRRALAIAGRAPVFVICVRDPSEVASSLAHRSGLARASAEALWVQHVALAERETRDVPRTFVSIDQLLSDWRGAVQSVARIEPSIEIHRAPAAIDAFIDPARRHHRATSVALAQETTRMLRDAVAAAIAGDASELAPLVDEIVRERCGYPAQWASPDPTDGPAASRELAKLLRVNAAQRQAILEPTAEVRHRNASR